MNTTATPQQKFIDKDVVFHAAMLLMQSNGQTSSLEVKTHLRGMGYWAKQEKVSAYLQELQSDHSWIKNNTSGYLQYSLVANPNGNTTPGNTALNDEIVDLIADTINYDDDIELSNNLSIDLGIDHLDIISIGMAIDAKYGIQSIKKDWKDILTVQDVVTLVESLLPVQTPVAQTNVSQPVSNTTTGKTPRKARSIINDSLNPSKSARVTINIDYKRLVIGATDAKQQCDKNEWFVSNKNSDPVIYDQKYTSDNVRTAYARLKGIKIQDVRASRVKNL